MGKLADAIRKFFSKPRSIVLSDLYYKVASQLETEYPTYYLKDIYLDPGGMFYAIATSGGKLYRSDLTQSGIDFTLGAPTEVEVMFAERSISRIGTISREGGDLWYIINGVAALNRVGEIDSRQLFDNMIARANESNQYPFLSLHHSLQDDFKLGDTTFLARSDYVYLSMGTWADSELAQAVKRSVESEPDYWGASIRFLPIGDPEILRAGSVEIPVYTDGVHIETAILAEQLAASLFTNSRTTEVTRMNEALQDAIRKAFGEDKTRADEWINKIDEVNRSIETAGMITREEAAKTEPAPTEPSGTEESPADDAEDALVQKVVAAITKMGYTPPAADAQAALVRSVDEINTQIEDIAKDLGVLAEAIEALSADDVKKREAWEADLTGRVAQDSTRPRDRKSNSAEPVSLARLAQETLANIEAK